MSDVVGRPPETREESCGSGRGRQYADILAGEIRDGTWGADTVRTRRLLVARFECPDHVIAQAIALLRTEGLVESRTAVGTRPKVPGRSWSPPKGSQTQHVAAVLRARIADGTYIPGQRLPNQEDLAQEFGVTRSIVGTALAPLKDEGLIRLVRRPRPGSVVNRRATPRRPKPRLGDGGLGAVDSRRGSGMTPAGRTDFNRLSTMQENDA